MLPIQRHRTKFTNAWRCGPYADMDGH